MCRLVAKYALEDFRRSLSELFYRIYSLGFPCLDRSAKTKGLKQIKAVLFVLMPSPMLLAYLPAYPFSKWPPAQERQALTSFRIA